LQKRLWVVAALGAILAVSGEPSMAQSAPTPLVAPAKARSTVKPARPAAAPKRTRTAPAGKTAPRPYTPAITWEHLTANPEIALVALGAAAIFMEVSQQDGAGFRFKNEGWFGKDTYAGGMDKLGHFWSSQAIADGVTWLLQRKGVDTRQSAATGAVLSFAVMTAIEIGDGFTPYGFSSRDMAMNALGVTFSYLRNTIPGFKETLDFRLQYMPSDIGSISASSDYSNKKFLFALKLSGLEPLKDTPWRFVEFHAGYFARGFSETERALGRPLERQLFAGIGLNLNALLLPDPQMKQTLVGGGLDFLLQRFQVPYTSISTAR
jgi:hypothetical protein